MTERSWQEDDLKRYVDSFNDKDHDALKKAVEESLALRLGKMMLPLEEVALLSWIAQVHNVRTYLEIGVFTGLNTLSMALKLGKDVKIHALDISETYTDIARKNWERAGVSHQIELYLGSALLTLEEWKQNHVKEKFDMIVIDADKEPTQLYYEYCLDLLKPQGILAIDNVLLNGRVYQEDDINNPPSVAELKKFNREVKNDPRVDVILLSMGDGLLLMIKK